MATTPNYGWVTPAPTDFVTDLPADFEVFADAVDADLAGLLGGTTGQVLTKISGTDHDFAFAAAAGGGELTWTLLNTGGTALTGAQTVSVSGLSGYDAYHVLIIGASSANAQSIVTIRPNGNSTATNYSDAGPNIAPASTYSVARFTAQGFYETLQAIDIGRMANDAAAVLHGSLILWGGNSTGLKTFTSIGGGANVAGNPGEQASYWRQGLFNCTSVISSFDILSSTGNFDAGTVYVFGGQV